MGWLFGHYTRKDLINHLVSGNGVKTIKHCCVGNNMWAVQEGKKKDGTVVRFVCLYLMSGKPKVTNDPCNWGYKDVDESMGPSETSCPVSYIALVEAHEKEHGYEPVSYAPEWRARVRAAAAKKSRKLEAGQNIRLYGKPYSVRENLGNRGYRIMAPTGEIYRMRKSQVAQVELCA